MKNTINLRIITLLGLLIPLAGCITNGIETPQYTVIDQLQSDSDFSIEVRRYQPMVQAVTTTANDDSGFSTLAGYIFGGNQQDHTRTRVGRGREDGSRQRPPRRNGVRPRRLARQRVWATALKQASNSRPVFFVVAEATGDRCSELRLTEYAGGSYEAHLLCPRARP